MKSYLRERQQTIRVESKCEIGDSIASRGVSQGSILFFTFMNKFPNICPDCNFILCADDTIITKTHNTIEQLNQFVTTMESKLKGGSLDLTHKRNR